MQVNVTSACDTLQLITFCLFYKTCVKETQSVSLDKSKAPDTTENKELKRTFLKSIPRETITHLRARSGIYSHANPDKKYTAEEIHRMEEFGEIRKLCNKIIIGCGYVTNAATRSRLINDNGGGVNEDEAIEHAVELKRKSDGLPHIPRGIQDAINIINQCYRDAGLEHTDS